MIARIRLAAAAVAFFPALAGSHASTLDQARVTRIINDVKLVEPAGKARAARVDDVVQGDIALRTGIKSRSELLFQDDTMSRIGPQSYFRFRSGTREITLEQGTLLLQVPKGLGGAQIHTAAVTASITGTTIMIEHQPKQDIKVLVLEGSLRLSTNGFLGDSVILTAGKMIIMKPDAKHIPDPVSVDLKKVMRTSKLVNLPRGKKGGGGKLPSAGLIDKEIARQEGAKGDHQLIDTNLVIAGKGTKVLLASTELLDTLNDRNSSIAAIPAPLPTPAPTPAPPIPDVGPSPTFKFHGRDKDQRMEERYGDGKHQVAVPLVINNAQDFSQNHGVGSIKVDSNSSVTVNAMLKVSDTTSNHGNGEININSRLTSGPAISVTSSGQLLALMSATRPTEGGKITFQSAGGDIDVNGATVEAGHGTVEMRNNGATGTINLTNATMHGNVVKIGALGTNGTLNVGGGSISADSTIKLYAGGSNGSVNFTDDVTLSGNSAKIISGDTVTIFNGKVVTINGLAPVDVFTNHPNYSGFGGNGSTTGTFAGQGANTHPLSQSPGF
jgi:hypothetical protein